MNFFRKKPVGIAIVLGILLMLISTISYAALPDTIVQVDGTILVVSDSSDYAGDLGTRTDQIDLTSVGAAAARQSANLDFTSSRGLFNGLYAAIEFATAPNSGETVDFYLCVSPSATLHSGGTSGSDAAYTGTAGDSIADSIKACNYIGSLVATSDATTIVQSGFIGIFKAPVQYANLVVVNNTSDAFVADAVEMGILITPLLPQITE